MRLGTCAFQLVDDHLWSMHLSPHISFRLHVATTLLSHCFSATCGAGLTMQVLIRRVSRRHRPGRMHRRPTSRAGPCMCFHGLQSPFAYGAWFIYLFGHVDFANIFRPQIRCFRQNNISTPPYVLKYAHRFYFRILSLCSLCISPRRCRRRLRWARLPVLTKLLAPTLNPCLCWTAHSRTACSPSRASIRDIRSALTALCPRLARLQ